jgi:hypothetical protein
MKLVGIKHFWVDLENTTTLNAEIVADVEKDGNISEFRKRYPLAEMEIGDYLPAEDLKTKGVEPTTPLATLITEFAGIMLRAISSETGYIITDDEYTVPTPALRQEMDKAQEDIKNLQQAVAELGTMVSVLTKGGS